MQIYENIGNQDVRNAQHVIANPEKTLHPIFS